MTIKTIGEKIIHIVDNRGKNPPYSLSGYPIIETNAISNKGSKFPDYSKIRRHVDERTYSTWFRSGHPEEGDILLTTVGNGIGNIGYMDDSVAAITQNIIGLRFDKDKDEPNYYYYFFKQKEIQHYLKGLNIGSAQPSIKVPHILSIEISDIPLPTQKRIAAILSALDDKIENNRRIAQTLEQIAQTIFKEKFSKKKLNGTKLGKHITPIRGKNLTKAQAIEGPYPVIAGGLQPSCYHNEYNTKSPVITISASGANAGYIQLHFNPVWSSDSSYIDTDVTQYIYFFYTFLKINQAVVFGKQEGSAQPHIYPSHIEEIIIGDFDENEIQLFEKLISPFYELIKNKIIDNEKLEQLRDTLLPKLMSGEIEV